MRALFLIGLLLFSTASFSNCLIRLQVNELSPITYITKESLWKSSSARMAEAIIEEAGCSAQYVEVSFKRALHSMELGKLDMIANLSYTKDRADYLHYLGKHRQERVVLVIDKESEFKIDTLEDLKKLPKPIGLLLGYYYGKDIKRKLLTDSKFKSKTIRLESLSKMANALRNKRISAFFLDAEYAEKLVVKNNATNDFKKHSFIAYENTVFFGISKKAVTAELYEKLKLAHSKLTSNGVLSDILKKYN